ncbi:MAG: hypothetical protein WAO20_13130, partial [Acidobacteriota bacterium]
GSANLERHRKGVYLALRLAHELVGADVPLEILNLLSGGETEPRLLSSAVTLLMQEKADLRLVSREVAGLWRADSSWKRLAAFATRIFVPRLELARMYEIAPDSKLVYLYYPYRMVDLLIRWSSSFLRLIRRDPTSARIAEAREHLSAWLDKC